MPKRKKRKQDKKEEAGLAVVSVKVDSEKALELSEELDQLITDLEERFDNMSEKAQEGSSGEKLQEKIDTLSEWRDSLTDIAEYEI